ncbi:hypothetical protein [Acinetobacter sp. MB5]|uniref:hypothetical protein n=1 Tax=Acinetobacter sp. MB5 TaxID=2069438 RepID=UPI002228769B|nr:hypothetical protein [Acinetobacter sp. MB5]
MVGFSNGGMLTYQLIAQKKTPFAAAAVVSAAMFVGQEQPPASMPLLIVHGLKDRVVPIEGGMSQMRFVARAQAQPFLSLNQTLERWQKTNQCQSKTQSDSKQFEVWSYKSCKADLQVYLLKEEGHTWVEAEDANQFDSTEAVWKFLKQHRKQ